MKKRMLHVFDKVSVLALFLAVVIAVTCLLLPGEVTAAWDGTVAANFQSGAGTQGNPYIISTPAQLAKFLTGLNSTVTYEGQYFALNGNIDMTGGTWDVTDTTFSGTLDGRGYTITADCAFLGDIGSAGTVQGLNYNCVTKENRSILSIINNGTVNACMVKGDVSGNTTSGLICAQNKGTVQSCGGIGTLSASGGGPDDDDAEAGMIAINSGTVKNCYAAVTAAASAPGKYAYDYDGPVVGKPYSGTVTNCAYDKNLYTGTVSNATGLTTEDIKGGAVMNYLGSTMPNYCGWANSSTFNGYPALYHLAHNYTAYVSGYIGQELTVYNSNSLSIGFAKVNTNGTIYYSTDAAVTDPSQFKAYSSGTISISGDTTVSLAVKYNNEFGAVTRYRFISLPGAGTESNPYVISQKYQLWLPEVLPSGYFKLANDLTFTDSDFTTTSVYPGGWDPIDSFTGTFDGQGHSISGLKGFKGGLFENVGSGGVVKNLRIVNHRLTGPGRLGAVVDSNNGGTISRCYTKSAFTHSDLPSFGSSDQVATVGGVVGYNYGTVEYCRNDGIVYATTTMGSSKPHIGGIVGDGGDIHHCVNTGDLIYGNDYSNNYADYVFMGGIAGLGRVENSKAVQNMYLNDGTDYSPYIAGISAWYSTGYADSCVADFTLYKNATFGAGVGQYAYCANTSYKCYNAETAQLPADCEELTFGYGGNWWVSNEGVMPQGVIGPDGHAWVLKSGGQILPTCTAKGDACLECAICGEGSGSVDHLETISALGHRYTSYTSNNDATCQADGTKTSHCDRGCGAISTLTDEGSKTDCAFTVVSDTVATAATCKDAATYYAKCATCGTVSDTVTLPVGDPNPTAHTFENGICSRCMLPEGLLYVIENNAVTVTGYTGSLTELPIPASIEGKPVTAIGERAFENCTFTTVALPSGITAIGKHAFIACKNLTNITLPTTNLGDYLFFNCTSLQHVGLPANLQKIPKSMFYGCTALENITIPAGVTEIGEGAFSSTGLKNVKIPENVIRIGANAFACCVQLQSVSIPSGVIAIEDGTFTYCPALVTVTGGSGITSVGEYAFNDCAALQNIPAFPNLKTVAAEAFTLCPSLKAVTLPAGVTSIAANAYDQLSEIYFGGTAQQWSALSSVPTADYVHYSAVSSDGHWKVKTVGATCAEEGYTCDTCDCGYERNKVTTETVKGHTWVAADCDTPKTCSVCSATEGEALGHTWVAADCDTPKTCSVCSATEGEALGHNWVAATCIAPKTCSVCSATEGEVDYTAHNFESGVCTLCQLPEGLTYTVDSENEVYVTGYTGTLSQLTIPATIEGKSVVSVSGFRFNNRLTAVTLPDSVKRIEALAFESCIRLANINIPEGVTYIGGNAFVSTKLTSVTIPEGVTEIPVYAFNGCENLTSVTLGSKVTTIGFDAFHGCFKLTSINLPQTLIEIGSGTFYGCTKLSDIDIPASVQNIGEAAFAGTAITEITIPEGIIDIFDNTFDGCANLKSVTLPDGLLGIGKHAFYGCKNLETVNLPASLTDLGEFAFFMCEKLTEVTIPEGVTEIGQRTFGECYGLGKVTIRGDVTSIGAAAFQNCDELTAIRLPDTVTEMGDFTFSGCDKLADVNIPKKLTAIASYTFADCAIAEAVIPEGVTTVGEYAFSACNDMVTLVLPATLTTVENSAFNDDTDESILWHISFTGTEEQWNAVTVGEYNNILTGVTVHCGTDGSQIVAAPDGLDTCTEDAIYSCNICNDIFTRPIEGGEHSWTPATCDVPMTCQVCSVISGEALGHSWVAADCDTPKTCSVCSATEGEALGHNWVAADCDTPKTCSVCSATEGEALGHNWVAADCDTPKTCSVCSATEGEALGHTWVAADCDTPETCSVCSATKGDVAHVFENGVCTVCNLPKGLQYSVANDVVTITGYTGGLTELVIPAIIEGKTVTAIGKEAFFNSGLTTVTLPDGVTSIGASAFAYCNSLRSVVIPDSVTSIGNQAFNNCSRLKSVAIPKNLTVVGNYVFFSCRSLKSITIPGNITSIGQYAFADCSGLTSITIQNGVTEIGSFAFNNCSNLTSITIPNSVTGIGSSVFKDCDNLTNVVLSKSISQIGDSLFYGCGNLTSITIPNGVTSIGNYAFAYCSNLKTIVIPDSMVSIAEAAFSTSNKNVWHVLFVGTESQWNDIIIGGNNYYLTSATIHCGANGDEIVLAPDGLDTCTEDAIYSCNICNEIYTKTIEGGKHVWTPATCENPMTCQICSVISGTALGHTWVAADCDTPKTCSVCSATEGEMLGHDWADADCITPKTCKRCSTTEGEALGHSFSDATCTEPKICGTCNTREGLPLGHSWVAADCDTPKTCSVCSVTEGAALGHNFVGGTCSRCEEEDPNYVSFGIITQPESVTVPNGAAAETTVKAVGDGLTYTWYFTNNAVDSTFSKSSITTATYSTTMNADRDGRKVYCVITDVNGSSITTATVTLSMEKIPLVITQQPADVTVVNGASAKTTVKATGDGLTYTWYFTSGGSSAKFSKSSATSATYSTTMNADRSGRQVYCVITDAYGRSVTSETATLYMKEAIKITAQPQNVKVPANQTATVTVEAEGEGLTYTWYYANKGKTTFTKSSYTTNTYSTIMDSTRDGRRVYCKITDKLGNSVKTVTVTMTMHTPLVITQQPANVMAAEGAKATTTVKAEGDGLKYAWYYTSGGSSTTFSKSSITTATYSTTMDTARDGRQVYCVITDKHGDSVTTNTVTLSMKPRTPLVITQQPANVSVGSGATAKTTVKAEGDGLTYAWYFTTNAADTTFSKSSTTTASYSTTMDASRDGRKVYCIVTDQYGNTAKTNTVTLSMEKTPLTITQQPTDVTVAKGAKAATTVKATGDGLKYAWYFTSGGTSTKFSKSSITSATYSTTMDATRNGRRVYCVITDAYGRSVTTNTVTLSMAQSGGSEEVRVPELPESITVGNGKTVSVTVEATGEGLSYQWYYTTGGTATKFYQSSNTTATYSTTMDSSRDGRKIYCVITDANGNSVTTSTVTLKMG